MLRIAFYRDALGREPIAEWMRALDVAAQRRVATVIQRMAAGNLSEVESVGGGVLERRIDWDTGYRIYFGRDGATLLILLGGGMKQRQQRDLVIAQERWAHYRQRKV